MKISKIAGALALIAITAASAAQASHVRYTESEERNWTSEDNDSEKHINKKGQSKMKEDSSDHKQHRSEDERNGHSANFGESSDEHRHGGWNHALDKERTTRTKDEKHSVTTSVVEPAAVPVPAAVWLLGSGLLGLVGVARRKEAA